MKRVLEVVRANRDRRASEIIQHLQQAVFDFTGLKKPQDDLTAVVIKVEEVLLECAGREASSKTKPSSPSTVLKWWLVLLQSPFRSVE